MSKNVTTMPTITNGTRTCYPLHWMDSWLMAHSMYSLESQKNILRIAILVVPCLLLRTITPTLVMAMVTILAPVVLPPHLEQNKQINTATFKLPSLPIRLKSVQPTTTMLLLHTKTLSVKAKT